MHNAVSFTLSLSQNSTASWWAAVPASKSGWMLRHSSNNSSIVSTNLPHIAHVPSRANFFLYPRVLRYHGRDSRVGRCLFSYDRFISSWFHFLHRFRVCVFIESIQFFPFAFFTCRWKLFITSHTYSSVFESSQVTVSARFFSESNQIVPFPTYYGPSQAFFIWYFTLSLPRFERRPSNALLYRLICGFTVSSWY